MCKNVDDENDELEGYEKYLIREKAREEQIERWFDEDKRDETDPDYDGPDFDEEDVDDYI
jgi:hypothetical protein